MKAIAKPRVKICCISSREEAQMAIQTGASALGLVSAMPSGPGVISEELIAEIAATIPPGVASFLLTSQSDASAIIDQQKRCRVNTIQICDALAIESYPVLREAMPGVALVQVIHVREEAAIAEAAKVAPFVNAALLDSGNPILSVKQLGGTGRIHDWKVSRQIRELLNIPVFLAGGLNPDNVAEAVHNVAPFGLDVCSGVRTEGRLDEEKLAQFCNQI
ncbi:MAG: phosphoribosylanthranilate isomerase [Cyanobacteriota bacterium]|nr:phosphoribosylanthranilate isomerase [Cyanobacteriota bacterium]